MSTQSHCFYHAKIPPYTKNHAFFKICSRVFILRPNSLNYYENLYREKPFPSRPYHLEVKSASTIYENDREHEDFIYNLLPTEAETIEAINNKSNGKSTTDIKNEMLKRPGEKMSNFLYPLIVQIWEEEIIPEPWNTGHITSIWKSKGDKEKLENHRGITTSSAIGSIMEMLIDQDVENLVEGCDFLCNP